MSVTTCWGNICIVMSLKGNADSILCILNAKCSAYSGTYEQMFLSKILVLVEVFRGAVWISLWGALRKASYSNYCCTKFSLGWSETDVQFPKIDIWKFGIFGLMSAMLIQMFNNYFKGIQIWFLCNVYLFITISVVHFQIFTAFPIVFSSLWSFVVKANFFKQHFICFLYDFKCFRIWGQCGHGIQNCDHIGAPWRDWIAPLHSQL